MQTPRNKVEESSQDRWRWEEDDREARALSAVLLVEGTVTDTPFHKERYAYPDLHVGSIGPEGHCE